MTKSGALCIIAESGQVFMDVTEMIDYNSTLLNPNDMTTAFFHLDPGDPTVGFPFDASHIIGHTFPAASTNQTFRIASTNNTSLNNSADLCSRLCLGSHLARHMRHQLEEQQGYTCTAGGSYISGLYFLLRTKTWAVRHVAGVRGTLIPENCMLYLILGLMKYADS